MGNIESLSSTTSPSQGHSHGSSRSLDSVHEILSHSAFLALNDEKSLNKIKNHPNIETLNSLPLLSLNIDNNNNNDNINNDCSHINLTRLSLIDDEIIGKLLKEFEFYLNESSMKIKNNSTIIANKLDRMEKAFEIAPLASK